MSPLRWIHGTISHWTVILNDVLVALTLVGGADGAVCERLNRGETEYFMWHISKTIQVRPVVLTVHVHVYTCYMICNSQAEQCNGIIAQIWKCLMSETGTCEKVSFKPKSAQRMRSVLNTLKQLTDRRSDGENRFLSYCMYAVYIYAVG